MKDLEDSQEFDNPVIHLLEYFKGTMKRRYDMRFVHVQSVLPQEDVIALKEKSGESSIKEAISKAVYHYLRCDLVGKNEDVNKR